MTPSGSQAILKYFTLGSGGKKSRCTSPPSSVAEDSSLGG